MFTVIGLMLGGMCIGFLLRKKRYPGIRLLITALIWILLFLLGIEVGSNRQIIEGHYRRIFCFRMCMRTIPSHPY